MTENTRRESGKTENQIVIYLPVTALFITNKTGKSILYVFLIYTAQKIKKTLNTM